MCNLSRSGCSLGLRWFVYCCSMELNDLVSAVGLTVKSFIQLPAIIWLKLELSSVSCSLESPLSTRSQKPLSSSICFKDILERLKTLRAALSYYMLLFLAKWIGLKIWGGWLFDKTCHAMLLKPTRNYPPSPNSATLSSN